MIKETITYNDFNGLERTEDFYFHFSEAELLEMELSIDGGLAEQIEKLVAAHEMPAIIKIFKDVVLKSYGKKSADGKQFIKNEAQTTAFTQTEAYSKLFVKLATNADAAARFINGIMPETNNMHIANAVSADHPALK